MSLLPTAGMIGGAAALAPVAPLGAPAGATIGGGGGEALRQLAVRGIYGMGPESPSEAAESIGEQGLLGAATEVAGPLLARGLRPLAEPLRRSAVRSYEQVLAPTKEINKARAEKVIPELINRRVLAASRPGLEKKLAAKTEQAGQAVGYVESRLVGAERAGLPKTTDTAAIRRSLLDYRDRMVIPGTRLTGNEAGFNAAVKQIEKLDELVTQQGQFISKESAIGLRRLLDEQVTAAKEGAFLGASMADKSLAKAQKEFANAIRRELAVKSPDFAKVNAEFNFWKNSYDLIRATNKRKVGQSGIVDRVLGATGMGTLGGAAGLATTGSYQTAAGAAVALYGLRQAMQTTAWRTLSAATKDSIANALASGKYAEVPKLLSRVALAPRE